MGMSFTSEASRRSAISVERSVRSGPPPDRELMRWGAVAGLGGFGLFLATIAVVVGFGLPDASDAETLTDFADIETGRIAEHLLYLGSLALFALHVSALRRVLEPAHAPAAQFGSVLASFGLVIMAASSMLHVSTAPLADLYTEPGNSEADLRAIEYSWHGAQSVFDTMLVTGALLVPLGIVLFGVAMRRFARGGARLGAFAITLGALGLLGALVEVVDTTSDLSAAGIVGMVVFFGSTGWWMRRLAKGEHIDLTGRT